MAALGLERRRRPVTDTARTIASHPAFARCTWLEVRRIARCGDIVEIDEGEVLWREGHIGYWFLAILSGTIELVGSRSPVAAFGPGEHVGADAIVSFGPEPATAVARSPVRAFVIGRRDLLELVHSAPVRAGLGLPEDERAYTVHVRLLRAESDVAWRKLPTRFHPPVGREQLPASFRVYTRPHRVATLLPATRARAPASPSSGAPLSRRSKTVAAAGAALALIAAVTFVAAYHPPVALARPGTPVDALEGVRVEGAPTHPVTGRYLVLSVEFDRPTVAALAAAMIAGERWVDVGGDAAGAAAAKQAFADSQAAAARLAVVGAGLDPAQVHVHVPDRDLVGPSAGLAYALAIRDLLDPADRAVGRTIAATGAIDDSGRVDTVWFVAEKARAARGAGAHVLLVPTDHDGATRVASVDDALAALAAAS